VDGSIDMVKVGINPNNADLPDHTNSIVLILEVSLYNASCKMEAYWHLKMYTGADQIEI
jgi:hypothetical protein